MVEEMQCINARSAGEKCKVWTVRTAGKQTHSFKPKFLLANILLIVFFIRKIDTGYLN
jgi:hypothetical protein